MYNGIFQKVIIPASTAGGSADLIIGLYASIKLKLSGGIHMFIFSILIMMDGKAVIEMTKEASNVISASEDFLETLNNLGNFKTEKWFRKKIRSLPSIKIGMGSSNYFDKLTPLVLLDFCINQAVSLMLMVP